MKALQLSGRLTYDGDLTGRPVSNSSTTYPNAGYGHMDDAVRLGYQAAMVSVHSPNYGCLWLSVVAHPGNTASCTQAEAMVRAAGAKTGLRPLRRTDLLQGRLQQASRERQDRGEQVQAMETELVTVETREMETRQQIEQQRALVTQLEGEYRERQHSERPAKLSSLGRARQKLGVLERRQARLSKKILEHKEQLARRKGQLEVCQVHDRHLPRRLEQVALLIEMGYEVYTKPYSDWLAPGLKRWADGGRDWTQVGKNMNWPFLAVWPLVAQKLR